MCRQYAQPGIWLTLQRWLLNRYRDSTLDLSHNNLTGDVPPLPPTVSTNYDYNCLHNCSFTRQPACPVCIPDGTTAASEVAALTALYVSSGGDHWVNSGDWSSSSTTDPVRVRLRMCSHKCVTADD